MTNGIFQNTFSTASGPDQTAASRDFESSSGDGSSQQAEERSRKEKTAVEWVSPTVRPRGNGVVGIEFDGAGLVVVGMERDRRSGNILDHVLVTRFDELPDDETIKTRLRSFVRRRQCDVHVVLSTSRAVVRHFLIPPVPARQRVATALWEGQKLIPFTLNDGGALWGLDFLTAGERGWWATLVAVPTEDAAPILKAIAELGWTLRTVSLIGTQRLNDDVPQSPDEPIATISWSQQRGCFSVYHHRQLVFHYDLGRMPASPSGMELGVTPESLATAQRWVDSLGVTVSDALDFHLNVNPTIPPSQLRFYGLPQAAAPLLSDWDSRFPSGVVLGDPIASCRKDLPEGVDSWMSAKPGVFAPIIAAMCGTVSVDLTPPAVQEERVRFRKERVARSAGVLSIAAMALCSGLMWARISVDKSESERLQENVITMQASPVSTMFDQSSAKVANRRLLMSALTEAGNEWMPWVKTVFAALPENAHLAHVDIQNQTERRSVIAHLEGTLTPTSSGHAITYREWFDRLRPLCGSAPKLLSEKSIDAAGTKLSAFTIELVAPTSLIPNLRGVQ